MCKCLFWKMNIFGPLLNIVVLMQSIALQRWSYLFHFTLAQGILITHVMIEPRVYSWYLYKMVSQNMLSTSEVKKVISGREKKIGINYFIDVTKCLQQIEIPYLPYMCAPCSELPYDI